ncbi:hypothetical protein JCM8547_003102 [Rhodosporidiobolus lusitaniae]
MSPLSTGVPPQPPRQQEKAFQGDVTPVLLFVFRTSNSPSFLPSLPFLRFHNPTPILLPSPPSSPPRLHSPISSITLSPCIRTSPTADMLMSQVSPPTTPGALPFSTTSGIALVLATQRKGAAPSRALTAPPASVVADKVSPLLLYYGGTRSAQVPHRRGTAPEESSAIPPEHAISAANDGDPPLAFPASGDEESRPAVPPADDEEADARSARAAIFAAQQSILRKEQKLRQLLGDDWQQGGSPPTTDVVPERRRRRLRSTSSQAPLIPEDEGNASSSTQLVAVRAKGRKQHRRGVSTPNLKAAQTSRPPVSPPIPLPPLPTNLDSPSMNGLKPFTDLRPILPPRTPSYLHTPPSPSLISPDPYIQPRCGLTRSKTLPLNRNVLSAGKKRELVKRSKKLEKVFGATFQEGAAQMVLIDGRVEPAVLPISPSIVSTFPNPSSSPLPLLPRTSSLSRRKSRASHRRPQTSPSLHSPPFPYGRRPSLVHSASSSYGSEVFEQDKQQRERDERRRRLEKVQRMLGERVPAELVVGGSG